MKSTNATTPDEYVATLTGWQRDLVRALRQAVRAAAPLAETLKYGHLVYESDGPVLLIRAEAARVLFGFWRGKRLGDLEPRLRPGGNHELATAPLREGDTVAPATVRRLVVAAVALNAELGDPRRAAKRRGRQVGEQAGERAGKQTGEKIGRTTGRRAAKPPVGKGAKRPAAKRRRA